MKDLSTCRLYTFVDLAYLRGRSPKTVAQQLCDGGSDLIQLRAKGHTVDAIRQLTESILPVTAAAGVPLVINDFLSVAEEAGAPLCHLGQEDFFDQGHTRVTDLLASNAKVKIGLSSHEPEQAERAIEAGAAYIAIGPVHKTGTKPTAKPVGLEYVRWAVKNVAIPWFAIGGINLETLPAVLEAGGTRVCVVSAILNQENIEAACREFKKRLITAL